MNDEPLADRMAAIVLCVALGVLLVPVSASYESSWDGTPIACSTVITLGLVGSCGSAVAALLRRESPVWSARLLVVTVALGLWTYPLVVTEPHDRPLISVFAWTAAGACVLVSTSWRIGSCALVCLVAGLVFAERSDAWSASLTQSVADCLFAVTTFAMAATVWEAARAMRERLRRAEAHAVSAYRSARDSEAIARRLVRLDAFVHDEVLAFLAHVRAETDPAWLRSSAARVLEQTSRWAEPDPDDVDLVADLLDAVVEHYPLADTQFSAVDELSVPVEVARAIVEAAAEALRNVARHAYAPTELGPATVSLHRDGDRLSVVVSDDGRGFTPRERRAAALGITLSIERRMASVGGRGHVTSKPRGTTVTLDWPAP
ncbi:hypothetical protein BH09ACT12_BH09ACT12_28730 [soil metagenome]